MASPFGCLMNASHSTDPKLNSWPPCQTWFSSNVFLISEWYRHPPSSCAKLETQFLPLNCSFSCLIPKMSEFPQLCFLCSPQICPLLCISTATTPIQALQHHLFILLQQLRDWSPHTGAFRPPIIHSPHNIQNDLYKTQISRCLYLLPPCLKPQWILLQELPIPLKIEAKSLFGKDLCSSPCFPSILIFCQVPELPSLSFLIHHVPSSHCPLHMLSLCLELSSFCLLPSYLLLYLILAPWILIHNRSRLPAVLSHAVFYLFLCT